jgi:hypothetical protein
MPSPVIPHEPDMSLDINTIRGMLFNEKFEDEPRTLPVHRHPSRASMPPRKSPLGKSPLSCPSAKSSKKDELPSSRSEEGSAKDAERVVGLGFERAPLSSVLYMLSAKDRAKGVESEDYFEGTGLSKQAREEILDMYMKESQMAKDNARTGGRPMSRVLV